MRRERLFPLPSISPGAWLGALMLLALLHGVAYVLIVPVWQAPDEPMLYEYAGLIAELGRVPRDTDRSPALEARIVHSQRRQQFWRYTLGHEPARLPRTLDESLAIFWMPRQVPGDPPLYFLLASLPLRLARGWTTEHQVLLLRLGNALLLPGVVACAYGAAREVLPGRPAVALAVAGFVALQPMFVATSTALSNDGLANLLGAALCWTLLRIAARGLSRKRIAVALVLFVAALSSKRTPLAYLVALLSLPWISGGPWRPRRGRYAAAWLLPAGAVLAWSSLQLDWRTAGGWLDAHTEQPVPRSWPGAGAALLVSTGEEVIQPLPAVGAHTLRNRAFHYGVHAWSGGEARGRLIVYTGDQRHEFPFELHSSGRPQARIVVPPGAPSVRVGLTADSGWFYADDLWASGEGLPGNLLLNGSLDLPALQHASPLHAVMGYLRLPDLIWAIQTGRPVSAFSYTAWARLLFASFWGHFGWMNVPFVLGSFWMPLLALCSLAGLAGILRLLVGGQGAPVFRRQIWLLLLLVLPALGLLQLNAFAEPSGLQQGRYLFPLLVPIALLLALGQQSLVARPWRRSWLAGWFGLWLTFATSALIHVRIFYG